MLNGRERVTWSASVDAAPHDLPNTITPNLSLPFPKFEPWIGPTATSRETTTPTPRRSLLNQSRRSVPSFLPSLQSTVPERYSAPGAISPNTSEPNASEPPTDTSGAPRPDVKSIMPSSVAYSETRTLGNGNGRVLSGAPQIGAEKKALDESRPKNDDIFLNIARTDLGRRGSLGRSDFRRVSLPGAVLTLIRGP